MRTLNRCNTKSHFTCVSDSIYLTNLKQTNSKTKLYLNNMTFVLGTESIVNYDRLQC